MRHTLKFALFLFIVNSARADEFEKVYGKGVLHLPIEIYSQVEMYSSPQSQVTHTLHLMHNAWSYQRTMLHFDAIPQSDSLPSWFTPLALFVSGESERLDFIVLDSSGGYYRTNLLDDQNREVWLKKTEHSRFLSWFGFYSSMSSIEMQNKRTILFETPTDGAHSIDYTNQIDGSAQMRPLEYSGMWMKVELRIPARDPVESESLFTGWIKWRDEKQPLVKYNLGGC